MPDVREVFEMVTKQVEPDLEEWREQERRQRRRNGVRKAGAIALVAAVGAALIVGLVRFGGRTEQPANTPTPSAGTSGVGSLSLVTIDVASGTAGDTLFEDVAAGQADVSPDGNHIAFIRPANNGHTQIYVAGIDGTNVTKVTGRANQNGCACGARDPDWSPDGRRIAFSGVDLVGNKDIYVLDVASGRIDRVTSAYSGEAAPDWSPDGSNIAFESGDIRNGDGTTTTGSIWIVDVASGHRSRIAAKSDATSPTWSPDGSEIAFSAATGGDLGDLWVVRPDGNRLRRILSLPGMQTAPAWSPVADRPSIAFGSDQQVSVLDLDSGQVRVVATVGADPAWSNDGSTIYAWRGSSL